MKMAAFTALKIHLIFIFLLISIYSATELHNNESISDNFSDVEIKELSKNAESFTFQAEVSRLMDIIINSLYSQKNVFLRELISNAADALEKARFMAVSDPNYLSELPDLNIKIEIDPEAKSLTIQDSGIGMTKDDLIKNLGTVARSGTTNFLEALAESGDINLIGQFGVGFYSAFLVADKVTVTSKHNNDADQHIWESTIGGSFTVAQDPRGPTLKRGTRITLHLKDDSTEYLSPHVVRDTILRFNQFVNYPIFIRKELERPQENEKVTEDEEKDKDQGAEDEEKDEEKDDEKKIDVEKDEEKKVDDKFDIKVNKEYLWDQINTNKPIWLRSKDNITDDEYKQFYKTVYREGDPLAYSHFSGEGEVEFKSIIFIPGFAPRDHWSSYFAQKQHGIKLYARRVLVADAFDDLLPKWLSFIKGVVDSDDLPLKVDRENLSQIRIFRVLTNKIVGKFFELLKKLAKDDDKDETIIESKDDIKEEGEKSQGYFKKFWENFGTYLKVGCVDDDLNRNKISKYLKYFSTKTGKENQTSLDQYVARMTEDQKDIFFISKENYDAALNSPHMQMYQKKNVEVLIFTEGLDEPCMQSLKSYGGKALVNIEKVDAKIDTSEDEKKHHKLVEKAYKPLTKAWSKYLKEIVSGVKITHKLLDDPAVITAKGYGNAGFGDRVMRSQTFGDRSFGNAKYSRILELNPNHPIIKKMLELAKNADDDPQLGQMANSIHDTALLGSGFVLDDPSSLSRKVFKLLQTEIGISADAGVEDFEVTEIEEDDEIGDSDKDQEQNKDDDDDDDIDMDTKQYDDLLEKMKIQKEKDAPKVQEIKDEFNIKDEL